MVTDKEYQRDIRRIKKAIEENNVYLRSARKPVKHSQTQIQTKRKKFQSPRSKQK
jgi:hypothetical protein